MQAFSFLHCGDVHLGAPFRGLADLPEPLAATLRDAADAAFGRALQAALDRDVAAVLVAGDLFDAADRNLRAQVQLRDRLAELDVAGIPVFHAAGNHDHLGGRVGKLELPASVHSFGDEVEGIPLERGGDRLATVYGISYGRRHQTENLAARFPRDPRGPFSIGLLHANVGDRPGHGDYAPCSLVDLRNRGFDYWALGHVHTRETLSSDRPVVHYPGNPQGLHANETGPRGVTLVEVSGSGAVELSPIWTDVVRWHRVQTPIRELDDMDDLLSTYADIAGTLRSGSPDRVHLIRWTLTGPGPLHGELRRGSTVDELTEVLREDQGRGGAPGSVWLDRLEVATRPSLDLERLREQEDLLGDFLRIAREARSCSPRSPESEVGSGVETDAEPEVCDPLRQALADLLDNHRIRNALDEDPWSRLAWQAILVEAENHAVEGLTREEDEE